MLPSLGRTLVTGLLSICHLGVTSADYSFFRQQSSDFSLDSIGMTKVPARVIYPTRLNSLFLGNPLIENQLNQGRVSCSNWATSSSLRLQPKAPAFCLACCAVLAPGMGMTLP